MAKQKKGALVPQDKNKQSKLRKIHVDLKGMLPSDILAELPPDVRKLVDKSRILEADGEVEKITGLVTQLQRKRKSAPPPDQMPYLYCEHFVFNCGTMAFLVYDP